MVFQANVGPAGMLHYCVGFLGLTDESPTVNLDSEAPKQEVPLDAPIPANTAEPRPP